MANYDDYKRPSKDQYKSILKIAKDMGVNGSLAVAVLDGAAAERRNGDFMDKAIKNLTRHTRDMEKQNADLAARNAFAARATRYESFLSTLPPEQRAAHEAQRSAVMASRQEKAAGKNRLSI